MDKVRRSPKTPQTLFRGPVVPDTGMATKKRASSPRGEKRAGEFGRAVRLQYGALPYRVAEADGLEILLVTSREMRRWIIPKGWPIKGLRPPESAAREAFEEAGVRGKVGAKSIGAYRYEKRLEGIGVTTPCEVRVFPMLVKRQFEIWPEAHQREARWFEADNAASALKENGLRELVEAFAQKKAAKKVTREGSSERPNREALKRRSRLMTTPVTNKGGRGGQS